MMYTTQELKELEATSIVEQVNLIVWSYINGIASDLVDGDN